MGRSKRATEATYLETTTPPSALASSHLIARVVKIEGNNLYTVTTPENKSLLVELAHRFRSTIWLKREGYVVVDTQALADRENKLGGEIVNIVGDEKEWRKMEYWPGEFSKRRDWEESDEDEESRVGKMPPNDSEEE